MPDRPRVIATRRLPARVEAALAERFEVVFPEGDGAFPAEKLAAAMGEADALVTTVADPITAETLGETPRARMLANFAVGVNNIDLAACEARGVSVSNTPGVLTDATADLAMTLILMTLRRAGEGERMVRAGRWTGWTPTQLLGRDPKGLTLGVVGMGRIGQATARRAHHGFGMRIAYANRSEVHTDLPATRMELDELMAEADVISLHCPGGEANRGLISAERIARMKPEAYLINTARGDVVDEPALVKALAAGRIAGAGLDVFEKEPAAPEALMGLENVTLLPHLGSATVETREAMGMKCVENLDAFFAGAPLPDRVV